MRRLRALPGSWAAFSGAAVAHPAKGPPSTPPALRPPLVAHALSRLVARMVLLAGLNIPGTVVFAASALLGYVLFVGIRRVQRMLARAGELDMAIVKELLEDTSSASVARPSKAKRAGKQGAQARRAGGGAGQERGGIVQATRVV